MTVKDYAKFFKDYKDISKGLDILSKVGLGYLTIRQPLLTLSGGETQRIKLASELQKEGNTYILDEPTIGLHMADVEKLIYLLKSIVNKGNTVIVVEHNLQLISVADWIIDIGPEGGKAGGKIIFEGIIKDIKTVKKVKQENSYKINNRSPA